jgi:hypothetical protein
VNVLLGCTCLAREGIALQSIGAMGEMVEEPIPSQKAEGNSLLLSQASPSNDNH